MNACLPRQAKRMAGANMTTTLQGHIKNGVVVFDGPMALPDGTAVRVEPVEDPVESLQEQFQRLKAEWNADTKYLSNPNKIMAHPAMRAIIAMGEDVVPAILHDLRDRPSVLVWALPEIVGPKPALEGNPSFMTAAWLQWGRENRLI
jgi:hypothetical protein